MVRLLLSLYLLAIAASCAPALDQQGIVSSTVPAGTAQTLPQNGAPVSTGSPELQIATLTPSPSPIPSPQPSATPVPLTATEESFDTRLVELIRICPENRYVPFSELGAPEETRLVIVPSGYRIDLPLRTMQYWLMGPQDAVPVPVSQIVPKEGYNHRYQVSPDGRWISFWRENEESQTLWIASLDGKQQWPVKEATKHTYHKWISVDEILILSSEEQAGPISLISINPFTFDEEIHNPIPARHDYILTGIHDQFRIDGKLYTIYTDVLERGYTYILFDHSRNKASEVFLWLDVYEYLTTRVGWLENDTFMITVDRPSGIDVTYNLDLNSIQEESVPLDQTLSLQFPEEIPPVRVSGYISTRGIVILVPRDFDIDSQEPLENYLLDTIDFKLYDYCISSVELDWDIKTLSPDGKFAELVYGDIESDTRLLGIMNLETGFITLLEGYYLIGWGTLNDQ